MAVYFVRVMPEGPVKIGHTTNIKQRLTAIQIGCPYVVSVVRIIENGRQDMEEKFHAHFAKLRLRGEWFEWTPEMATIHPRCLKSVPIKTGVARRDTPQQVLAATNTVRRLPNLTKRNAIIAATKILGGYPATASLLGIELRKVTTWAAPFTKIPEPQARRIAELTAGIVRLQDLMCPP